jgi:hypothetical protein
MVQSIADWSALIGCGVGVLGLSTALNKGTIDSKDTLIRYLERQNEDLKESLQKEREQSSSALERLQKALENPSLEKIASEFPSQYAEILEILDSLSNLADEFEDCKRAAEWLEIKKNLWIEKATQEIWERHKGLLFPFFKKEKFKRDLGGYLEWIYACLYRHGGSISSKRPVSQFVPEPTFSSSKYYVEAIEYLIERHEWGDLESRPKAFLQEMLFRLRDQLKA